MSYTYCPADVCCQLVLDDKVEDRAGGCEPPLQEQDGEGGVHHEELAARGRSRLLTHSPAHKHSTVFILILCRFMITKVSLHRRFL